MSALDNLKQEWKKNTAASEPPVAYDAVSFNHIIQTRMKMQHTKIFRYFWATFTFHVLVYALLSHAVLRYWGNTDVLLPSLVGMLALIPFTAIMLRRYKQMAVSKANGEGIASIRAYVERQQNLLSDFFSFKRKYELVLIPVLCGIMVMIIFEVTVPGAVTENLAGAVVVFLLALAGCIWAIRAENRRNFIQPLRALQAILDEYNI